MTDKEQIIIDGVDVSKCGFIHPEISKTQCHIALAFSDQYEECTNCEQIEDCYFKQLARKTQECENLTRERDYLKQIVKGCPEVACENGGFCAIDIENKNLRKQVKDMIEWQKEVIRLFDKTCRCDSLDEEAAICKENGKECISIVGCRDPYRKALEEIEEMAKTCLYQDVCVLCPYSDKCENPYDVLVYEPSRGILDIINKAKGTDNGLS